MLDSNKLTGIEELESRLSANQRYYEKWVENFRPIFGFKELSFAYAQVSKLETSVTS
jgi:hypothetical protein